MKYLKKIRAFFLLLFVISLAACSSGPQLPYRIDNGKIEDEFQITLSGKNIILKPNEIFSLPEKGLEGSQKSWKWNSIDTEGQYAELKKKKYPVYDITITKKGYKMYFGKIVFFNLSSSDKTKANTRPYYQIKIDSRFFDAATNGQIKYVSDAPRPTGKKASKKSLKPTWIIWLSDAPF
ncbi:MAG: hypothetical protein ABIO79_14715 [Ferruginibacter sp.]